MANRDLSPSPSFHHPPPPPSYLLHNATLVDVAGERHAQLLKSTTVAIQDGLIASVSPLAATGGIAAPTTSRPGRTVIDCTGLYLCPGLVADFHGRPRRRERGGGDEEDRGQHGHQHFFHHHEGNDDAAVETAVRNAHAAQNFCAGLLRKGITSVRDVGGLGVAAVGGGSASAPSFPQGGSYPGMTLGSPAALRDAVDGGVFPGPRLFVSEATGRVLGRRRGSVTSGSKRGKGDGSETTSRTKRGGRRKGRGQVGKRRNSRDAEHEDEDENDDDLDDERTRRIIATSGKGDSISQCVQAVREELLGHRQERRDMRRYGRRGRRGGKHSNVDEEDFLKIAMHCFGEEDGGEAGLFSTAEIAAMVECAGEEGERTYVIAEVVVGASSGKRVVGEAVRRCALGGVRGVVVVLASEGEEEGIRGFLMEEDEDGETAGEVLTREGVGFTIVFTGKKRGHSGSGATSGVEERKEMDVEDEEGSGDGHHLFEENEEGEASRGRSIGDKNEGNHDVRVETLHAASEAGVTICFGMHDGTIKGGEFGVRAKAISAEEILRSATINPAAMLGREMDLGQIREGFEADILFLSRDPLEDISILDDPERYVKGVMKGGRIYKLGSFDALGDTYGTMRRIKSLL